MFDAELVQEVQGEPGGGALSAKLCVPPEHALLAGHFPGAPVVPGVLLLAAVGVAWERVTGRGHRLTRIDDVRWSSPLAPGVPAELRAMAVVQGGDVRITGEWLATQGRLGAFEVGLQSAP